MDADGVPHPRPAFLQGAAGEKPSAHMGLTASFQEAPAVFLSTITPHAHGPNEGLGHLQQPAYLSLPRAPTSNSSRCRWLSTQSDTRLASSSLRQSCFCSIPASEGGARSHHSLVHLHGAGGPHRPDCTSESPVPAQGCRYECPPAACLPSKGVGPAQRRWCPSQPRPSVS